LRNPESHCNERLLCDSSKIHATNESVNKNAYTFTTINMLVLINIIEAVKYYNYNITNFKVQRYISYECATSSERFY
jgi:hypothetical protein